MPPPTTSTELLELTRKSEVVDEKRLSAYVQQLRAAGTSPSEPSKLAGLMVRDGVLTLFQAEQLLQGKWKRFTIGKYKVLEKLGSGGMGQVFLCEHKIMRRRVAVKVLPTAKVEETSSLERFHREARAVAALDHPNIVRAYDVDNDDHLHFLVMEYVDGTSLQDLVKKHGPMDPLRCCHYMHQSAHGLQHAFDMAGLVHRDIKPGNILIDRTGTVKILDMGLARFFHDEEDLLTKKYDESVLGTADYLAPEQAIDSHGVDIKADIYSLGATWYFMLTGNPPFTDGSVAQKLIWHQTKEPKPVTHFRQDVAPEILSILRKMMAKDPANRYQSPQALAAALEPLVTTPIPPPPEHEMPRLSPAATGNPNTVAPAGAPAPRVAPPPAKSGRQDTSRTDFLLPTAGSLASAPTVIGTNPQGASPKTPKPRQPAPPPPRPAAISAPAAVMEEPLPNWNQIAFDTPNPKASADTAKARPTYRPPTVGGPKSDRIPRRSPARAILVFGAVVLAGVAIAIGGAYAFGLLGGKKPKDSKSDTQIPPPGPRTLLVDLGPTPGPTAFRTVHQALAAARTGDRILVKGEAVRESWYQAEKAKFAKGVTVEADVPAGEYMPWKFFRANPIDDFVLNLESVEGITFRKFAFDGNNQANIGVFITGRCPDIVFDDVRVINCKTGFMLNNAAGDPDRPIRLSNVRVIAGQGANALVELATNSSVPIVTTRVVVEDCQLEGPSGAFVIARGNVKDVTFRRNRCWNATQGFVFQRPSDGTVAAVEVKFQSNTFHTVAQTTMNLESLFLGSDRLEVTQNYFANCKALVSSPEGKPIPNLIFKSNARDSATTDGNLKVDAPLADYTFTLNPNVAQFLRYPKNSPLAKLAVGNPVGAPPVE